MGSNDFQTSVSKQCQIVILKKKKKRNKKIYDCTSLLTKGSFQGTAKWGVTQRQPNNLTEFRRQRLNFRGGVPGKGYETAKALKKGETCHCWEIERRPELLEQSKGKGVWVLCDEWEEALQSIQKCAPWENRRWSPPALCGLSTLSRRKSWCEVYFCPSSSNITNTDLDPGRVRRQMR